MKRISVTVLQCYSSKNVYRKGQKKPQNIIIYMYIYIIYFALFLGYLNTCLGTVAL